MQSENEKINEGTIKKVSYFIASVFGVGFIKFAPGTFGSLVALPVVWLLMAVSGLRGLVLCFIFITIIGYIATAIALRYTGEVEDPAFIVMDELAAQMAVFILPFILFPAYIFHPVTYIGAFVLFRLFDILKPLDVGVVDKELNGALGVMLDDFIAAFYAAVCLCAVLACFMIYYGLIYVAPVEVPI